MTCTDTGTQKAGVLSRPRSGGRAVSGRPRRLAGGPHPYAQVDDVALKSRAHQETRVEGARVPL